MPETQTLSDSPKRRWLMLAIVYAAQIAFAIVMQSVPPVLNLIINDLGISHAQAGLLMGAFALPGIFLSIMVGSLGDKYGAKYLVLGSLLLMFLGTAFSALSPTYVMVLAGRLITGVGAVSLIVMLPQFLSRWWGKDIGIAMGIYNTGVPVGGLVSFVVIPLLAGTLSWRAAFWMGTATSLLGLVLFSLFYSPPPAGPGPQEEQQKATAGSAGIGWPIWLVAMSWMFFNAGFIAFITFAPDFLTNHNAVSPGEASRLTSYIMWGPLLLSTAVGLLLHKYNSQRLFIGLSNVAAAAAVMLVYFAPTGQLLLIMLIVGVATAFVPASIFSLPALLVPKERLGLAFGILSTTVNISIIGGPFVVGLIRDSTGSYLPGFITIAIFILCSSFSVVPLRKTLYKHQA